MSRFGEDPAGAQESRVCQPAREPPHAPQAEEAVLGGLMLTAEGPEGESARVLARMRLTGDDFFDARNGLLFDALVRLIEAGRPIDLVSVATALEGQGLLEKLGGSRRVAGLLDATPSYRNIEHHAQAVRDRATMRRILKVSRCLVDAAQQSDLDAVKRSREQLARLPTVPERKVEFTTAHDIRAEATAWLWDEWLPRGEFTLFAAQGGSGKGTFCAYLSACVTNRCPWPDGTVTEPEYVAIYSPEDSPEKELVPRLTLAGADLARVIVLDSVEDAFALPEATQLGMLVVDPIRHGLRGKNNDDTDVRAHVERWMEFAKARPDTAVVGVHHVGKYASTKGGVAARDLPIGASAWVDVARWVIMMTRDRGDPAGTRLLIRAKGNLGGVDYSQGAWRVEAEQEALPLEGEDPIKSAAVSRCTYVSGVADDLFFEALTPPASRTVDATESEEAGQVLDAIRAAGGVAHPKLVAEDTGIHLNTVRKWIGRWCDKGVLRQRRPTSAEVEAGAARNGKVAEIVEGAGY